MARGSKRKRRIAHQDDIDFDRPMAQEDFGRMVGEPQQTISKLCRYNVLSPGGSARDWTRDYIRFMFGQIYARHGWAGLARALGD